MWNALEHACAFGSRPAPGVARVYAEDLCSRLSLHSRVIVCVSVCIVHVVIACVIVLVVSRPQP